MSRGSLYTCAVLGLLVASGAALQVSVEQEIHVATGHTEQQEQETTVDENMHYTNFATGKFL